MNEIVPNLFLGTMVDGYNQNGKMPILCVLWDGEPNVPSKAKQIATTGYIAKRPQGGTDAYAIPEKMDEAADWIHERLERGERVLVHCAYGIERSPLTVVWYLMRYHGMNLKEAYDHTMGKRKEVQYRGEWLPREIRLDGHLGSVVKA